jgi:PilZ domain
MVKQGLSMENRWSDRRDLRLGVDVYSAGEKLLTCSSQNIGLGGTCLQFDSVERGQVLRNDQEVELIFHVPQGERATKYSLQSKVVWLDERGVGLKFQDHNTSVFRSLQELINYKQAKTAS